LVYGYEQPAARRYGARMPAVYWRAEDGRGFTVVDPRWPGNQSAGAGGPRWRSAGRRSRFVN